LQDYLGADDQAIDATFFNHTSNESFSDNKISELIKTEFSVAENCYSNTLTENDNIEKLFTISPNPSNNSIILSGYNYNGDIRYKIYDLNSKLILEGKVIINEPINISSFMNGIYLITLKFNNRAETHRIIKN